MRNYTFTVPAKPQGKGRGKAFSTPAGIRVRTPEATRSYESLVRAWASDCMGDDPQLIGPVVVQICAVWPRSKHLARISKRTGQPLESTQRMPYTSSPDIDNVIKSICDGCNGIIFKDDRQVVSVAAVKLYAAMVLKDGQHCEELPHVRVIVTEWQA